MSGSHSSALSRRRSYSLSSNTTSRRPLRVRYSGVAARGLRFFLWVRVLVFIKFPPMADLRHDDPLALNAEPDAVIAGPQAIPSGQVARQSLDSTDGRPSLKPANQLADTFQDDRRQPLRLLIRFGSQLNGCHY